MRTEEDLELRSRLGEGPFDSERTDAIGASQRVTWGNATPQRRQDAIRASLLEHGWTEEKLDASAKAIAEQLTPLRAWVDQVPRILTNLRALFEPVIEVARMAANVDWDAVWEAHQENFRRATAAGWFILPELPTDVLVYDEALDQQGNLRMLNAVNVVLPEVEARLGSSFPHRKAIISEAFALHREKRYIASIPLLLSSSDGIVVDATNLSPFSLKGSSPEVALWVKKLGLNRLQRYFVEALTYPHPLSNHVGDSRHRILHGQALDYGSEEASLQAITLLGFIGWLFCPDEGALVEAAKKAGWKDGPRGWGPPR